MISTVSEVCTGVVLGILEGLVSWSGSCLSLFLPFVYIRLFAGCSKESSRSACEHFLFRVGGVVPFARLGPFTVDGWSTRLRRLGGSLPDIPACSAVRLVRVIGGSKSFRPRPQRKTDLWGGVGEDSFGALLVS